MTAFKVGDQVILDTQDWHYPGKATHTEYPVTVVAVNTPRDGYGFGYHVMFEGERATYGANGHQLSRGIVKHDIHAPEGVLQGPAQSLPSSEEGKTGRAESGSGVSELSGEGSGLSGLPPQRPSDENHDDLPTVRGDVGVASDSTGDRPLRGAVRELPSEGTRGATSGEHDPVSNPAHYTKYPVEVIEITEQLDFCKGNVVKYVLRAGLKAGVDELEDLSKAAWYLARAIENIKKARGDGKLEDSATAAHVPYLDAN